MSDGAPARIGALILRQFYLLRTSWPRLIELAYWPTMQLLLWGFIQQFLAQHSDYVAQGFGVLLGAVFLWDLMFRSQIGLQTSFTEEVYARNLGHLLVSPLRTWEFVAALMAMSVIRTAIGLTPAALIAAAFFGLPFLQLGLPLVAFFVSLILFGWAVGLVASGIILRFGLGAEELAWALVFAVQPIVGVYYPLSNLPAAFQAIAALLPPSYVFEGMRAILLDGAVRADLLLWAFALNAVWLGLGLAAFAFCLKAARARGLLVTLGE